MKGTVGLLALAFAIIIGIIVLVANAEESTSPRSAPPPAKVSPAPTQPTPPPPTTPRPTQPTFAPIVIKGSDSKTSSPFVVTTNEWVIDWEYKTDDPDLSVFSFFVYPRGETTFFVESVLFPDATSGSTYSYAGAGEYYVKVATGNIKSWTITIRPP